MTEKNAKKFRFLPLIPYGICSRQALYLVTRIPEISYMPYSPEVSMKEREEMFASAASSITANIDRMLDTGYIEEKNRKYGDAKADCVRAISLTKAGLYLLCGYPTDIVELERVRSFGKITNIKLKANTYRSTDEADESLREMNLLRQGENDLTAAEIAALDIDIQEAIKEGEMTLLSCDSALAPSVNINNPRFNGIRVYRNWRLSNIAALFMANNYLTYIDRRPMDTGWTIGTVYDKDSYQQYLESGDMDIPAFMFHALNKWYKEHPNCTRFLDPLPDKVDMAEWANTPAFYSTIEIPGFYSRNSEITAGQKNNIIHSLAGVAIGRKLAYIVHHTKHKKTPWGTRWESTAINIVENALEKAGIKAPSGEPFHIEEAIVVCGSIGQFLDFFKAAREHISKRWRKENKIGSPYKTICMIPLNGSGAMQIRYLMLFSPQEMDYIIVNNLMKADSRFTRTGDGTFPLSFEGTPVLIAHSMQLQTLYDALLKYEDGMKFYVSCYPGQTKYIRRIMPDVEFL